MRDDWQDAKLTPPPDDHNPIELRFGDHPEPLRSSGFVYHRINEHERYGAFASKVRILWRRAETIQ